jgi:ferredoxin--NADP+ reductase
MSPRPFTVAVVGAGPAGIYTSDFLQRSELQPKVDLFERLPVPFGLVRYGVAPDHPRIKGVVDSLHTVLEQRTIRFIGGVDIGTTLSIEHLRGAHDAVILTTGADSDAALTIPGIDLPGSFGASQFVTWYDAHPDAPTTWPLDAESVAVVGAGNVALDVARLLAKHADDLADTEIPDHVADGLRASRVRDVHLFARRGPAEAAFSPLELRELGDVPDVDIIVDPQDLVFDRSSEALMASSNQRRVVARTIRAWAEIDPASRTASRRIHLHFMQAPVALEGQDHVEAITVERTRHLTNGTVEGTGEYHTYPVGQVYRAVGYASSPLPGVPYDAQLRRIPNTDGRVHDGTGRTIPRLYVSGWIKRGPVGLIGSTKSDSLQTVASVLADAKEITLDGAEKDPLEVVLADHVKRTIDWDGWLRIDEHERQLGTVRGRERLKVHSWADLAELTEPAQARH